MSFKTFQKIRLATTVFIAVIVSQSIVQENLILAIAGIISGMIVMTIAKRKIKEVLVDERIKEIQGKAAIFAYTTMTVLMGFSAIILSILGRDSSFLNTLGSVFSYLTLLSIALYALAFRFLNNKQL